MESFLVFFKCLCRLEFHWKISYPQEGVFLVPTLSWPRTQGREQSFGSQLCVSQNERKKKKKQTTSTRQDTPPSWRLSDSWFFFGSLSVHGEERTNLTMVTLTTTLTWQEVPDNPNALGCIPVCFDRAPAQRCSKLAVPGGSWLAGLPRGITDTAPKQLQPVS